MKAFIRGIAAERFCVRNSGVTAVCEVSRALLTLVHAYFIFNVNFVFISSLCAL